MKEHQRRAMFQGRQLHNSSSSLKHVRSIPPSRLSSCDHSEPIVINNISKSTQKSVWTRKMKWSWIEDFPGARIEIALMAALLVMIATTFAVSVYIQREGLMTQLQAHFDGKAQSNVCLSRSMMARFPYEESSLLLQQLQERSEGQQIFDMTLGDSPGC